MPGRPTVRFGPFELTPETGELRKHGLHLRLQEQPFHILTVLVDRPGELVTREELTKALWPDGTFVDFEKSLNSAVTRLRQVLADSAENPRYIETVARRGYRFIAPVERPTSSVPVRAGVNEQPRPARSPRLRAAALWAGPAVVGIVAVVLYTVRGPGEGFREPYTATPLTRLPGNERDPSFSPDGREVAFAWDGGHDGPFKLFVKRIGSETLLDLTKGTGDDRSPAWSPHGAEIAFLRRTQTRISVMIVSALGGPERTLAEMPPWGDAKEIMTVSYLCWSTDGRWLVYPEYNATTGQPGLSAFAPRTGEKRSLTRAPNESLGDFSPALSPDSRMLSFVRLADIGAGDLYVMELADGLKSSGAPTRIPLEVGAYGPGMDVTSCSRCLPMGSGESIRLRLERREDRTRSLPWGKMPATWRSRLRRRGSRLVVSVWMTISGVSTCRTTGQAAANMPAAGGREERVLEEAACYSWAIGRLGVWFVGRDPGGVGQVLKVLWFSTGAVEPVALIPKPFGGGIAVSPDEGSVLYVQVDRTESDLVLVENFPQ